MVSSLFRVFIYVRICLDFIPKFSFFSFPLRLPCYLKAFIIIQQNKPVLAFHFHPQTTKYTRYLKEQTATQERHKMSNRRHSDQSPEHTESLSVCFSSDLLPEHKLSLALNNTAGLMGRGGEGVVSCWFCLRGVTTAPLWTGHLMDGPSLVVLLGSNSANIQQKAVNTLCTLPA